MSLLLNILSLLKIKSLHWGTKEKKSHGAGDFITDFKTYNITDFKIENHFFQSGQNFSQF